MRPPFFTPQYDLFALAVRPRGRMPVAFSASHRDARDGGNV